MCKGWALPGKLRIRDAQEASTFLERGSGGADPQVIMNIMNTISFWDSKKSADSG